MSPTAAILSVFKHRRLIVVECFILKVELEDFSLTECQFDKKQKTKKPQ